MPDKPDNPFKFWEELKRRKVVMVIIVYAAAAYIILELISIISEPFGLPEWTLKLVFVLLCVGLIISIILSWIYDITPEGVQKTKPSTEGNTEGQKPASIGWKISTYVSLLVIIAIGLTSLLNSINKSSDLSRLEKTIAVLPFENFCINVSESHLGDALSNEIATQLAKIQNFEVRSFTSSLQYRGVEKPSMPEIGTELNANFVIEGSVELQEEDISIHVQIIQTKNDKHIWAHEFNGKWNDIISIRANISKAVASALKTILTPEELKDIEKIPTENLDAYNYYLRGNVFYSRSYEKRDWTYALNMYNKAIELDPQFALPYTMIARSHLSLYWFHHDRSRMQLEKSLEAIEAALNINPDLGEAYLAYGVYYYHGHLDYKQALKYLQKAQEYLPNNGECLYYIACVLRRMGDLEEAKKYFIQAISFYPNNVEMNYNTACTYYLLREYSNALRYFNSAIGINPEFAEAHRYKIDLYLNKEGNIDDAKKALEEASLTINLSHYPELIEKAILIDIYEGRFQNAIDYLNTVSFEAVQPQFYYYPKSLYYAKVYNMMNDSENTIHYYNLSRLQIEEKIRIDSSDSRLYSSLGICYAGLGQKGKAIIFGKKGLEILPIEKESWRGYHRLMELALIYVMVGEYELALEQLDILLSIPGELSTELLHLDPAWKPLWDKPGFKQLIERYSDN
ncbi:MAG: tetratricopeptide repeat protein [Marinilabiliaceae bacterium]|jgi:TolB-like protein/Flp pilus assembly protein TadD|nr:tetratricopeptide repeat protein [Marinilabiliaceae bacterium]